MPDAPRITPCLWFDDQAEAAANFYTGIFRNSRVTSIARYGEAGREVHGKPAGSVMIVAFELDGQAFTALNGGPVFTFNEAISFQVRCETQADVDHYWEKLSEGGDERAQQCGWLKDRYGVSWGVAARALHLGVSIDCPAERVYAFVADPENLPRWATAFVRAVRRSAAGWVVDTPGGPVGFRFVERNDLGVLDHYVSPSPGVEILNPMRVVPRGAGSEVIFTLFQLPDTSDEAFAEDAAMVERDLRTLKAVLEGWPG
jgi:predicted 3-demethylubiquinone-9 3-methyltransferase (glyoxalase superfamily)